MYGNLQWYSKSRSKFVHIGINGGAVYYDKVTQGFDKVPEDKRIAVINAEIKFCEELEKIFQNDSNVKEV